MSCQSSNRCELLYCKISHHQDCLMRLGASIRQFTFVKTFRAAVVVFSFCFVEVYSWNLVICIAETLVEIY